MDGFQHPAKNQHSNTGCAECDDAGVLKEESYPLDHQPKASRVKRKVTIFRTPSGREGRQSSTCRGPYDSQWKWGGRTQGRIRSSIDVGRRSLFRTCIKHSSNWNSASFRLFIFCLISFRLFQRTVVTWLPLGWRQLRAVRARLRCVSLLLLALPWKRWVTFPSVCLEKSYLHFIQAKVCYIIYVLRTKIK